MEQDLFRWSGWDECGMMSFVYYDVVFEKDFGPIKKGDKFETAYLDYESGTLQLVDKFGVDVHTIKIELAVQGDVTRLRENVEELKFNYDQQDAYCDGLLARIEALEGAIRDLGTRHFIQCISTRDYCDQPCNCGMDAARSLLPVAHNPELGYDCPCPICSVIDASLSASCKDTTPTKAAGEIDYSNPTAAVVSHYMLNCEHESFDISTGCCAVCGFNFEPTPCTDDWEYSCARCGTRDTASREYETWECSRCGAIVRPLDDGKNKEQS